MHPQQNLEAATNIENVGGVSTANATCEKVDIYTKRLRRCRTLCYFSATSPKPYCGGGGAIPQVSSAVAHSTRVLNMFLPLRGNFTSSNEIVVTYSYLYSNVPISLLMVKRFSGASSTCPTTCASILKLRDMSMMACASSGLT